MKVEIKVPAMGESISEATIGTLLKAQGAAVKIDDEILELETEKVNQVLYAQQAGTITWETAQGDTVKIGQVIGSIDSEAKSTGNEIPQEKSKKVSKNVLEEVNQSSMLPAVKSESESDSSDKNKESTKSVEKTSSKSPRSSKDQYISEINESYEPKPSSESELKSEMPRHSEATVRNETRKKMSKIRKAIASKLVDAMQQTAMLTTFNEVDMTKIISLRDSYKEAFAKLYATRLGFMPFFVKASVAAMQAFPEINAYIDGEDLVYREYFDIGIAVGTDKGLFVPVIRNCDHLTFAEIEHSIESFAIKAREGGLSPGDLQGGGFTITNGGTYGSLLSTPIINPPQCAILGMHKIMKRPIVLHDQVVIRQMMYLALSYDHRIVDGKEAVSFLVHIKNTLEEPSRILIGI